MPREICKSEKSESTPVFFLPLRPGRGEGRGEVSTGAKASPTNNADATLLSQFVNYGQKRFDLGLLLSGVADGRPRPEIPARPVVLGEVVRLPSFLQLQEETKLPQWRRWVGYKGSISHDTFGCVSERLDPAQLRRLRSQYGPRFFDVVAVDSWYAKGPFLKTVGGELGWPVVVRADYGDRKYNIVQFLAGHSQPN
jgi:hypothetical protein